MVLSGSHAFTRPGQFCQISLPGYYLRRPFSVCEWTVDSFTICYRPVGAGTDAMTGIPVGSKLDILTGLGNGFDPSMGQRPVLIAGGMGAAPLLSLALMIRSSGRETVVLMGFNDDEQVCLDDLFCSAGCAVHISTIQPGCHVQGQVTGLLEHAADCDYLYCCGPELMMRELHHLAVLPGQYSLECRMGCGFGVCNACHIRTTLGARRICYDGPIFRGEELLW